MPRRIGDQHDRNRLPPEGAAGAVVEHDIDHVTVAIMRRLGKSELMPGKSARGKCDRSRNRKPVRRFEFGFELGTRKTGDPADHRQIERGRLPRSQEQPTRRDQDGSQIDRVDDCIGPSDRVGLDLGRMDRLARQLDRVRHSRQDQLIGKGIEHNPSRVGGRGWELDRVPADLATSKEGSEPKV